MPKVPPGRTAVNTLMPQLLEEFKQAAMKKPNLDEVKVQLPEGMTMTAVDSIMLKHLLLELVNDSVNIISERKGKQNHWSQDPLHTAVLRKIFGKLIMVKGVSVSLHAETFPLPMPFLRTESAPLRMVIRGEVKSWVVKPIEDLRTYTDSQMKAKCYSEDWIVAIFGSSPQDRDHWEIHRPRGKAIRHHLQPRIALFVPKEDTGPLSLENLEALLITIAVPYDSPGPKVIIRDEWTSRDSSRAALEAGRWTGTTEFAIKDSGDEDPVDDDPVIRGSKEQEDKLDNEDREAEALEEFPDHEEPPTLDPPRRTNFDFRRVLVRLPRLAKDDPEQAMRLLLGLHERFWHANASDMESLLSRSGMPSDVIKLIPEPLLVAAFVEDSAG